MTTTFTRETIYPHQRLVIVNREQASSVSTQKAALRNRIESDVERYLANGGTITVCEAGASGDRAMQRIKTNNLRGMKAL